MIMKTFNVVVKKEFLDRYSGIKHKPGEKMSISESRFREIQRSGNYVEIIEDGKTNTSKSEK